MSVANFIIAGTEKAGTTSVFSWLAQHPQVTISRRKETNFFWCSGGSLADYAQHFPQAPPGHVVAEASPAYLGEAEIVVPRMRAMLPEVRLLFILREPVARLRSSFDFHRGRLMLPGDLDFHDYLGQCLAYADGDRARVRADIDAWYLDVLPFGRYAVYLRRYYAAFPAEQIMISFYDELRDDPRAFMVSVSRFLGIDSGFWESGADLSPQNVTFAGRHRLLHRAALALNDLAEPVLRPRPRLKSMMADVYKRLNGSRDYRSELSEDDRRLLEDYYAPYNRQLESLLSRPLPPGWHAGEAGAAAAPAMDRGEWAS